MPRQKTGRPLGRRPVYQDESERPVTVSLRIPRDLEAQMKRGTHAMFCDCVRAMKSTFSMGLVKNFAARCASSFAMSRFSILRRK